MEEQTTEQTPTDWLNEELAKNTKEETERLPSLILEENKVINLTIDFTEPFKSWTEYEKDGVTVAKIKKMVPVKVGEVNLLWWLNVKNPIYTQILQAGAKGQTDFKVLQTGNKQTTKYTIVTE